MVVIGLTGSIGMGKSVTAEIFRETGIPVHDADKAVHRLYRGRAAAPVAAVFPSAVDESGVNRSRLAELVLSDQDALKRLEAIIHPLVAEDRREFIRRHSSMGFRLLVCDVPLLFETGTDQDVDVVVVVSAPSSVQKTRVLSRPGMTEERFSAIMAKQLPDAEKRRRAHVVIGTDSGLQSARRQVSGLLRALASNAGHAPN